MERRDEMKPDIQKKRDPSWVIWFELVGKFEVVRPRKEHPDHDGVSSPARERYLQFTLNSHLVSILTGSVILMASGALARIVRDVLLGRTTPGNYFIYLLSEQIAIAILALVPQVVQQLWNAKRRSQAPIAGHIFLALMLCGWFYSSVSGLWGPQGLSANTLRNIFEAYFMILVPMILMSFGQLKAFRRFNQSPPRLIVRIPDPEPPVDSLKDEQDHGLWRDGLRQDHAG